MSRRERMNVKVDADLVRKAKVVAATKHMPLSDYINALLGPLIEEDLRQAAAGLIAETAQAAEGRPTSSVPGG